MRTRQHCARALLLPAIHFLALLSLPGCSDVARFFGPTPNQQAAARHRSPQALPLPHTPPAVTEPPVVPATTEPAPPPAPEPTAIVVTGLSSSQLVKLLGEPLTRVPTGQGERWTYQAGECQLDVFMFPDVSHGGLTALDDRVGGSVARSGGEQACLRRLRDDHAT